MSTGVQEAIDAGKRLKEKNFRFDIVFTSVLKRAITTFNTIAEQMNYHHLPIIKNWRLNERHYGALEGLNKAETAAKHGEDQVKIWRRSYDIPPPALDISDARYPGNDARYKGIPTTALPRHECLKDTVERIIPFWHDQIGPAILSGQNVLVVAHGNSIRGIVKFLDNVSDAGE
jgi:2,3-bisphosphoglycerate-dependent phosphoglycerate mutase